LDTELLSAKTPIPGSAAASETILRVNNMSVAFGSNKVLKDFDIPLKVRYVRTPLGLQDFLAREEAPALVLNGLTAILGNPDKLVIATTQWATQFRHSLRLRIDFL